ncbi:regulator of telomere elongation helicase 1 homolog isoform X2 [Contarinia nasturtii]|nr:regulator of telomere elongation helicase 1 homolog isoform X2 [Contarinia nasturtii]
MEKVIEAIEDGKNAVLESPTGTGKTHSLLCSPLAWIEKQKSRHVNDGMSDKILSTDRKIPLIIFASRTHSQIKQAMKALKESPYNDVRAAVIGSRNKFCIHEELKDSYLTYDEITDKCKFLVDAHKCQYYEGIGEGIQNSKIRDNPILDIEELTALGQELKCCPYFITKMRAERADLIFMPYDYLINPMIRKSLSNFDLKNAIVIVDEASNILSACEEAFSTSLSNLDMYKAMNDFNYVTSQLQSLYEEESEPKRERSFYPSMNSVNVLKAKFKNLFDTIRNLPPGTRDGKYIFELLSIAEIDEQNQESVCKDLEELILFVMGQQTKTGSNRKADGLRKMCQFIQLIFISSSSENFRERINLCYKVEIVDERSGQQVAATEQNEQQESTTPTKEAPNSSTKGLSKTPNSLQIDKNKNKKTIKCVCLSPAFGMKNLCDEKLRCLILTSGTLAPLHTFVSELGILAPIRHSFNHIIKESQVFVEVVKYGPDNEKLDSRYENRENIRYVRSLGKSIIEFSKVIPDGLLVFFSAYEMMNKCIEVWKEDEIWTMIEEQKSIFIESKQKWEFEDAMNGYRGQIEQNSKGAILMAVMRGKISEGLDFKDKYARGVCITGIPLASIKDLKVKWKKEYLNKSRYIIKNLPSGEEWYYSEAYRAVNQAIGRVIRNKNDYGAILLCDDRFDHRNVKQNISSWLQKGLRNQKFNTTFGSTTTNLATFFDDAENTLPKPKVKVESNEPIENPQSESEKSINFNNISADNCPQVTIHALKRNGVENVDASSPMKSSPSTSSNCDLPKKTKFDTVPNNLVSPSSSQSVLQTSNFIADTTENPENDSTQNSKCGIF